MKRFKIVSALCLTMALGLTGCGSNNVGGNASGTPSSSGESTDKPAKTAVQEKVVLKIPHYKSGQNVGAKFFLPQVERFNTKYADKYEIRIEEVPNDDYNDKIKLLWQQKELPALIEKGANELVETLIEKDEIFDLKPFLDSKPELKASLIEDSVSFNTRNGKIYTMPTSVVRPIGLFYNKEMFADAGITKPIAQMNFEEFDQALQALKDKGITPLSLMTGENAWTTMLLASAFMANEPGAEEVLKSNRADKEFDYTSQMWVKAFGEVQKWLKEYTTDNALGAAYADSANNFLNEKTAIIANGTWMVGDFSDATKAPEGFDKKVGVSLYPGGIGLATTAEYSWWIPKGLKQEETEAALAFIEFIHSPEEIEAYMVAEGGQAPNILTSAEFTSKLNPILAEMNRSVTSDLKMIAQSMADVWPDQISSKEFSGYLPLLAQDKMTPEQFAEHLTKKAQQFKK